MDFEGRLAQANGRLKVANVGVKIQSLGDRLYLRATLPARPGSNQQQAHQQRVALKFHCNPAGIKLAEAEARKIGALLDCNQFSWEPYLTQKRSSDPTTCGDWVERFQLHYREKGGTDTTWKGDYEKVFRRLPLNQPLTAALVEQMVLATKPNSRARQRACMALGVLCKFAAVDYDPSRLRGNYSPSQRHIPSDETIAEFYYLIPNPAWRWVYGMMATYGLRNHEVFHLNLKEFPIIEVLDETKTGRHQVFPCYPEWAEQWHLDQRILPKIDLNRSNEKLGHSVTSYLSPKLPFVPYDLRHGWAVRTLAFGFPVELAAQQMGHSVEVHTRTYHRWINAQHYRKIFSILMERGDRPKPPSLDG